MSGLQITGRMSSINRVSPSKKTVNSDFCAQSLRPSRGSIERGGFELTQAFIVSV
jgi:hypothetical protein